MDGSQDVLGKKSNYYYEGRSVFSDKTRIFLLQTERMWWEGGGREQEQKCLAESLRSTRIKMEVAPPWLEQILGGGPPHVRRRRNAIDDIKVKRKFRSRWSYSLLDWEIENEEGALRHEWYIFTSDNQSTVLYPPTLYPEEPTYRDTS